MALNSFVLLFSLIVAFVVHRLWVILYRIYLHPLASFPGPKIAAATHLYEIAWDYFGHGAYLFHCEELHKKYGPILRITPDELMIKDPDYYNTLYVTGSERKTNAWPSFGDGMDFNGSHGMTVDHDQHRMRRKPLEPYFSRQGVLRVEHKLDELVLTLTGRLSEVKGTGKVIRLDHALAALAGDVVSAICVEEPDIQMLRHPEFNPEWYNLFHTLIKSMPLFMNFAWIIKFVRLVPSFLLRKLDARSQMFRDWRIMAENQIIESKRRKASGKQFVRDSKFKCDTLFDTLVNSDLPEQELSTARLASEAQVILGAGTVTTARSMDHLCVHILLNDRVRSRLGDELRDPLAKFPDQLPSWTELEKLPYLHACIQEGLRLSHGLMHRLPRCSQEDLIYKEWLIPKGTPVGMSAYYMHTDPDVYDNPFEFRPERWLGDVTAEMRRNYVPFTKGSRGCLGINLAYAEMSMVIAALFCPKGPKMNLFETDASDADPACAFLLPLPRLDSKGIRVTVE